MTTPADERRARILDTYRQTGSIKATTRLLGIGRTTVRNLLRGTERARAAPPAAQPLRPSKLDAFKPHIQRLVLEDRLTATLVLEEIKALGYTGGYSILKRHVRAIRPVPKGKVTTRIEHGPGSAAQVDWSPHTVMLAGETRIVHCFSLVLPFSRYMVVRYALDEKLDTLTAMHEEAFSDIGAVPATVTYDNMTTVGRHLGPGEVWINPRFEEYAKRAGFGIHLISQGKPNQHASVERPFHYIENNFLPRHRKTFDDLDDLNRRAKEWCDAVANVRVHGTTRERPVDRLVRERVFFKPLPTERPESFKLLVRQVGTDFCVVIDTHRYSVPPRHANARASVRLFADRVEVLVDGQPVAVHPRSDARHARSVLPEHEAEFLHWTPSKLLLEQAFLRLGEAARAFHAGLLAQRGKGAGHHLQRLLKMADRYSGDAVVAAMLHAARYGNFSADAVAAVITGKRMPGTPLATPAKEPPEQIRLWLAGLDVETGDLADYDRMVDATAPSEEDAHGQG
ncbi:MAG: IS21 family transposase [Candidatus Sericytochromatia bacterium]